MGQKFFLHKNKKVCYHIINTCSCGLSFPRKLAGLTRRVLVYVRETMRKVSRNRPQGTTRRKKDSLANQTRRRLLNDSWIDFIPIIPTMKITELSQKLEHFFKKVYL
ncbi:MAG: hypothetical protein LBG13_02525 [Holosporales bacterium]|nr:hypothetical protein [Holosporales bacterium]